MHNKDIRQISKQLTANGFVFIGRGKTSTIYQKEIDGETIIIRLPKAFKEFRAQKNWYQKNKIYLKF
jgi:hypothetical protein